MASTPGKQARFAVYINGEKTMDKMADSAEKTCTVFTAGEADETTVKVLKLSEAAEVPKMSAISTICFSFSLCLLLFS